MYFKFRTGFVTCASACVIFTPLLAQYGQQGPKLVGTGAVGNANQGQAAALSADGTTLLSGGNQDNGGIGAAWVFTRSASSAAWMQQGNSLVGIGAAGNSQQGYSVALSADGNTALIGGPQDGGGIGAVWVWTRSGGVWTQQGAKLVAPDAIGNAQQGYSVSLSPDGNTALVGGPEDGNGLGAAWVWTRSGGVWTEQSKLPGTGAVSGSEQGYSVALSADGNTAAVGGPYDNPSLSNQIPPTGAVWIHTRSNGVWTQQGAKLVGAATPGGSAMNAEQGYAVSLSADGNTLLEGGPMAQIAMYTCHSIGLTAGGAVWIWMRSNGVWVQQSPALSGTGGSNYDCPDQGRSVALSADGSTAAAGSLNQGVWIWSHSGSVWTQQGAPIFGTGALNVLSQGWSVALSADAGILADGMPLEGGTWVFVHPPLPPGDFDGNGVADVALQFPDGSMGVWYLGGTGRSLPILGFSFLAGPSSGIRLVDVADLNRDGVPDMILQFSDTSMGVWYMGGPQRTTITDFEFISGPIANWMPAAVADLNGDSQLDLIIQNSADGSAGVWYLGGNGGNQIQGFAPISGPIAGWKVVGSADLNIDGHPDLVIQYTDGTIGVWYLGGAQGNQIQGFATIAGPSSWSVVGVGDMDWDGHADLTIRNTDGTLGVWYLGGAQGNQINGFTPITTPGVTNWRELGAH